jgi:hypothetical protein
MGRSPNAAERMDARELPAGPTSMLDPSRRRNRGPTILRLNVRLCYHRPEFFVDAETYADAWRKFRSRESSSLMGVAEQSHSSW